MFKRYYCIPRETVSNLQGRTRHLTEPFTRIFVPISKWDAFKCQGEHCVSSPLVEPGHAPPSRPSRQDTHRPQLQLFFPTDRDLNDQRAWEQSLLPICKEHGSFSTPSGAHTASAVSRLHLLPPSALSTELEDREIHSIELRAVKVKEAADPEEGRITRLPWNEKCPKLKPSLCALWEHADCSENTESHPQKRRTRYNFPL